MAPRFGISEYQVYDPDFVHPEEHEGLHDRDTYIEIIRQGSRVSVINEWMDSTKTYQYSSTAITRQRGKVTQIIKTIYDYATGSGIIATVTGTVVRQSGRVTTIEYTRDNDMQGVREDDI